ncbi:MAG TPA: alpha/beta fold hydrolase, partial [Acidimicrobiales bacterium]|nr:alpha/beta fold hydrolase [Acidimicrobiales bacterium]
MRTRGTVLVGAIAVAILSAACSSATPRTQPAPTTGASTRPLDPDPTPPALVWTACGPGLQCSRLRVPVDYAHPDGAHLELAVIRRPALDPARRIGALVMNPGGPGASGVGIVRNGFGLGEGFADRLDIVSWDTRGTGASAPLACDSRSSAFLELPPDPIGPVAQAQLDARARAVAATCAARAGPLLLHMDTDTTARDLEQLRRALGGTKLTYAGFSYGTAIGLAYAARYP